MCDFQNISKGTSSRSELKCENRILGPSDGKHLETPRGGSTFDVHAVAFAHGLGRHRRRRVGRPPFCRITAASNGALGDANRVTTSGGLGACLQVYIEGHNAVLIDDVGDGRALHLQGAPGHHGRWRYAVERHRPLIGRMDGEVA